MTQVEDVTHVDARPVASTEVAAVADNFIALARTFNRTRARFLAAAARDVEWSSQVLLKCLSNDGPMRASELAECVQSDPSTVSRQVAGLVKEGLLERRADPDDGRASLLVLTDRARAIVADHDEIRLGYFAEMLSDWQPDELRRFAQQLLRFTTDYENANNEWITERIARGTAPAGGTD
jgi:DNA-binding MarR family transcriptional regulator